MKRTPLALLLLPLLCLASCGESQFYGDYEFRLGKTDGSHIGLSASLTNEDYAPVKDAKKLVFSAEFGAEFSIQTLIDQYQDTYPLVWNILKGLIDPTKKIEPRIEGYYVMTQYTDESLGTRIRIGSDFIGDFLKELIPAIGDVDPEDLKLAPEIIEKVVAAYLNKKQLTLRIPVSFNDLSYQLFWYGLYIDLDNPVGLVQKIDVDKLPGPKGEERVGVHPKVNDTADEVKQINDDFAYTFSHTAVYAENGDGISVPAVSLVVREETGGKKRLHGKLYEGFTPASSTIVGSVYERGILGEYSVKKDIKITLPAQGTLLDLTYNDLEGDKEGFTDLDGRGFTFNLLMQKPYTFRNFHDVRMGLTKKL